MFVAAADSLEIVVADDNLSFRRKGFTALGHPSSISIGALDFLPQANKHKHGQISKHTKT